jgi:hypothetical protein
VVAKVVLVGVVISSLSSVARGCETGGPPNLVETPDYSEKHEEQKPLEKYQYVPDPLRKPLFDEKDGAREMSDGVEIEQGKDLVVGSQSAYIRTGEVIEDGDENPLAVTPQLK